MGDGNDGNVPVEKGTAARIGQAGDEYRLLFVAAWDPVSTVLLRRSTAPADVIVVDAATDRLLVEQYRVKVVPCVVIVAGGVEQRRVTGTSVVGELTGP